MATGREQYLRNRLEARQAALLELRARNVFAEHQLLIEREPDPVDVGTERAAASVLGRLAENERDELLRIGDALWRMDAGSWGFCEDCGERIDGARLEAVPEATRCYDCESATRPAA